MSESKLFGNALEQEKELVSILIDSSIYREMPQEDKQKLLNYLVSSYFSINPHMNNRALPEVN
jgi:hypothetical protein